MFFHVFAVTFPEGIAIKVTLNFNFLNPHKFSNFLIVLSTSKNNILQRSLRPPQGLRFWLKLLKILFDHLRRTACDTYSPLFENRKKYNVCGVY